METIELFVDLFGLAEVAWTVGAAGLGMLGFGGWVGKRYWALKKRVADLEKRVSISQTIDFDAASDNPRRAMQDALGHETLRNLTDIIRGLPQEPMGNGATYADLPEHTRVVSLANGEFLLALPISATVRSGTPRIEVKLEGGSVSSAD